MGNQALVVSPYEIADIMLIRAVTNLHPGVGRTGEIVDLPVQKDNLGFPIIYSSSIKGALKSAFWHFDKDYAKAFFGPEPEEREEFTSAIAILDAFTIVFPVRSLEGVYAFATSPLLLHRLNEYIRMAGREEECKYVSKLLELNISGRKCYTSTEAAKLLKLNVKGLENKLIINEEIEAEIDYQKDNEIRGLEQFLNIEKGRLVLLNNNEALRAIERSLVRVTRIAIERKRKTVKEGMLWTEEYIPRNTVFATLTLYSKAKFSEKFLDKIRSEGGDEKFKRLEKLQGDAEAVRKEFHELLGKSHFLLIIGGNETIGRGIVELKVCE